MISDQKFQYFKEEYSGHKLIYVRFSNEEFLFKSISLKEYEMILKMYNNKYNQETAICNISCIYPEEYEFQECEYGILPSVISGYVKALSGFEDPNVIFNDYYVFKSQSNLFQQCLDLIKAFIGDYSYEEMEEWTWQKIMQMTVRAENIAKLKGFDWHIEKNANLEELTRKPSIHNKDDVENILNNKINPLIFFVEEIVKEEESRFEMVNKPFIIGNNWNNKDILNGFREQLRNKKTKFR